MLQNEYNTNACLVVATLSCCERFARGLLMHLSFLKHYRMAQFTEFNFVAGGGAHDASALSRLSPRFPSACCVIHTLPSQRFSMCVRETDFYVQGFLVHNNQAIKNPHRIRGVNRYTSCLRTCNLKPSTGFGLPVFCVLTRH